MMSRKAAGTFGVGGGAAACAWWVLSMLACGGSDTPTVDDAFKEALQSGYAGAAMGVAGAGTSGSGSGGDGGSSEGGSSSGGSSGDGGSSSGSGGGSSGSGGSPGGGGSGSDEPCDAPGLIFTDEDTCGGAGSAFCHGTGSANGAFAENAEAAAALLDQPSINGEACGLFIDSRSPEDSLLLTKTNGEFDDLNCGPSIMPLGAPDGLSPDQQECIASWLSQFAD